MLAFLNADASASAKPALSNGVPVVAACAAVGVLPIGVAEVKVDKYSEKTKNEKAHLNPGT